MESILNRLNEREKSLYDTVNNIIDKCKNTVDILEDKLLIATCDKRYMADENDGLKEQLKNVLQEKEYITAENDGLKEQVKKLREENNNLTFKYSLLEENNNKNKKLLLQYEAGDDLYENIIRNLVNRLRDFVDEKEIEEYGLFKFFE